MTELKYTLLGVFTQLEMAISSELQREDIVIAKSRGVYIGRKRKLSSEK